MKTLTVKIKGTAPILFNNGNQVDPLNPLVMEKKKLTSKRIKTEEDLRKIADLEWMACLYLGEDDQVIIPNLNFEACIRNGAKKSKLGKQISAGLMVENDSPLIYKGPKDVNELMSDRNYRLSVPVRMQQNKVIKTRPLFKEWGAEFTILYNESLLNHDQVVKSIEDAGLYCGLGDWIPKHGRFEIESINLS